MDADIAVFQATALENGGGMSVVRAIEDAVDADVVLGIASDAVVEPGDIRLYDDHWARVAQNRSRYRSIHHFWRNQSIPALHDYDIVIESGYETDWYTPQIGQGIIKYVHGVPSLIYDRYDELATTRRGQLFGLISRTLRAPTYRYPDRWIVNSDLTRREVADYIGMNADVVYPPVDLSGYEYGHQTDHYVIISRLTESKGVQEAVETCIQTETPLVVCGTGPLEDELRTQAVGSPVEIRGWVSESKKRQVLREARGLIAPSGKEGFGIVAVEAFAAGLPVIAKTGGYLDYLIDDGWNGVLYEPTELADALTRYQSLTASPQELEAFATQFGYEAFTTKLRTIISEVVADTAITTEWEYPA